MLRTAVMLNSVRRHPGDHDVIVTANNEADFGTVGVQYVHYPWNMFPRPVVDLISAMNDVDAGRLVPGQTLVVSAGSSAP